MNTHAYRFEFIRDVDLDEAESNLHQAIIAAEGLFGEALVRMSFCYRRDDEHRCLFVRGDTEVGDTVVRIFTQFATEQLGATAFTVSAQPRGRPAEALEMAS